VSNASIRFVAIALTACAIALVSTIQIASHQNEGVTNAQLQAQVDADQFAMLQTANKTLSGTSTVTFFSDTSTTKAYICSSIGAPVPAGTTSGAGFYVTCLHSDGQQYTAYSRSMPDFVSGVPITNEVFADYAILK